MKNKSIVLITCIDFALYNHDEIEILVIKGKVTYSAWLSFLSLQPLQDQLSGFADMGAPDRKRAEAKFETMLQRRRDTRQLL